jgi:hypothetical protein
MSEKLEDGKTSRRAGLLLGLTGLSEIVLLALHPDGKARDFAGVLQDEAAHRVMDAIVHGGFIFVLVIQLVLYAVLSIRLNVARTTTIAAFVFTAAGTAFLSGSLLLDGLVIPTSAAHYVAATSASQSAIRPVFAVIGIAIGWLMPLGLGFQGLGIAFWGLRLAPRAPLTGGTALLLGAAMLGTIAASGVLANPGLVMIALGGGILWALMAALWLLRSRNADTPSR